MDDAELDRLRRAVLEAGTTGRRIGRYVLGGELGRGASGVVHRAVHEELGRPVALKILSISPGTLPEEIERFRREARLAATLRHPNVVQVHDVGAGPGFHYLAMELVEGTTFAAWSRVEGRTLRDRVRVLAKAARGVAAAHAAGIVHRDLKPANLLVDRDDEPRVADFGLARSTTPGATFTGSGMILGTPAYMSPEQVRGDSARVDARADVWALGAMLHEVLAGRPPFEGAGTADLFARILELEPGPLPREAPPGLAAIARQALDKDAARRQPDAGALADDLERWLRGEPVGARGAPAVVRAARFAKRRRFALVLAGGALVAAVLGTLGWQSNRSAGSSRRESAELASFVELEQAVDPLAARADARRWAGADPGSAESRAILADFDAAVEAIRARHGVADGATAFRGWLSELLGDVRLRVASEENVDPFARFLAARLDLRLAIEKIEPPDGGLHAAMGSSLEVPDPELRYPAEARELLRRADSNLASLPPDPRWARWEARPGIAEERRALVALRSDPGASSLSALASRSGRRTEALLLSGRGRLARGDRKGALETLSPLLAQRPPIVPAQAWAGLAQLHLGFEEQKAGRDPVPAWTQAVAHWSLVIDVNPAWGRVRSYRAFAYWMISRRRTEDPAAALRFAVPAIQDHEAEGLAPWPLATYRIIVLGLRVRAGQAEPGELETLLRGLPPADPGPGEQAARARAYLVAADHAFDWGLPAADLYRESLRSGVDAARDALALYHRGQAYLGLSRSLPLDPAGAREALGRARADLSRVVQASPDFFAGRCLFLEARIQLLDGEADPAASEAGLRSDLSALATSHPENDTVLSLRIRFHVAVAQRLHGRDRVAAAEEYGRAGRLLETLVPRTPGRSWAPLNLSYVRMKLGDLQSGAERIESYGAALAAVEPVLRLEPRNLPLRLQRGKLFLRLGLVGGAHGRTASECLALAEEDLGACLAARSDSFEARVLRAEARERRGNPAGALEDARAALALRPGDARVAALVARLEAAAPR